MELGPRWVCVCVCVRRTLRYHINNFPSWNPVAATSPVLVLSAEYGSEAVRITFMHSPAQMHITYTTSVIIAVANPIEGVILLHSALCALHIFQRMNSFDGCSQTPQSHTNFHPVVAPKCNAYYGLCFSMYSRSCMVHARTSLAARWCHSLINFKTTKRKNDIISRHRCRF